MEERGCQARGGGTVIFKTTKVLRAQIFANPVGNTNSLLEIKLYCSSCF